MIDWTKSMIQTYEVWKVDPYTWGDVEKIPNVTSCSITRDPSTDLLQNATLTVEGVFEEIYVRVYIICIQDGQTYKECLGTFLVQTPSETYDGKAKLSSLDAYSPLVELKDKYPPFGYSIGKNTNIMDVSGRIVNEQCRAPVIFSASDKSLDYAFAADTDETWLAFIKAYISNADYSLDLDELSRIIFRPYQPLIAMRPRYTFDTNNSSIVQPSITVSRDLYGTPNVVEVLYSKHNGMLYSRAVNDRENSVVSTVRRGREVVKRITNPDITGTPTQSTIDEYARRTLENLSIVEYEVKYTHGYYPVRVGDCVRLNHPMLNPEGINAKITSQIITLGTGIMVEETSRYTSDLLGG